MKFIEKRTGIIIFLSILIIAIVSGCSKPAGQAVKTPEVSQIEERVMKNIDTTDMIKLDDKKLERVYGIKADEIEGFFIYVSTSNVKADEIAVIKVKDSNEIENIKSKIADRLVQLGTSFKDYLPEQYSLIEKRTLEVKGNYIFLVVSKNGAEIKKSFDKCFE